MTHDIGPAVLVSLIVTLGMAALAVSFIRVRATRAMEKSVAPGAEPFGDAVDVRFVAEHIGDTVMSVGPDGACRYISPGAARIFGIAPANLAAQGIGPLLHPEDRQAEAVLRHNLLAGVLVEDCATFRVMHAARGMVWVEARARRRIDPRTGTLNGYYAVLRDVTARKAMEDVHGKAETQYRLLAENTSDAITCMDLELTHTYISPTFSATFGYKPEQVVGEPRSRLVHPDDLTEVYRRLHRLVCGDSNKELVTYRLRHQQGHYLWVESNFTLVREPLTGRPASVTCSVRDVSERRAQAEALQTVNAELQRLATQLAAARDKAEQANQAKSRFLASVSHELRTPLNGVLGYAELLRGDPRLAADQVVRVDAMLAAGQHLLDMIDSVLDLSEIEAERLQLHPKPMDVRHAVEGCADLVRPAAQAKGLTLDVAIAQGVPVRVMLDRTRLRQILLNLLGNAVKFTVTGGVCLRLRPVANDSILRLEVADSGPGISVGQRSRLFRDFERLNTELGAAIEGSGLGLALSARLAALMGGQLGHADNPAGGSIFWCELPLKVADSLEAAQPAVCLPDEAAPAGRRLSVLVVDDVPMNRDVAGAFLTAAGHEIALAEDGGVAADMAAARDFDVILMDVRMPRVDGLEATRRIRRIQGARGRVPIVALTAQAFAEQVRMCREAGMDSHLAKPFNRRGLLHAVEQAAHAPADNVRAMAPRAAEAPSAMPLFDERVYAETASFLPTEKVISSLTAIAGRTESLLAQLHEQQNLPRLAPAAHSLAGSASLFGFLRISETCRRFEAVVPSGDAAEIASCLARLRTDLGETLAKVRTVLAGAGEPSARSEPVAVMAARMG